MNGLVVILALSLIVVGAAIASELLPMKIFSVPDVYPEPGGEGFPDPDPYVPPPEPEPTPPLIPDPSEWSELIGKFLNTHKAKIAGLVMSFIGVGFLIVLWSRSQVKNSHQV